MKIQYSALTDVGRKREHNEDNLYHNGNAMIFCVADGMGGAAAGEVASEIVAQTAERDLPPALKDCADKGEPDQNFERHLARAIETANSTIQDEVRAHPEKSGMGSTCVLMHLREGRIHYAHVGDSRIYRFRRGKLEQLTEDHSWVNESLRNGIITAEEAKNHRFKNVITRAVGTKETVLVDTRTDFAAENDIFLMCSDGLMAGKVSDEEIERVMASSPDVESTAKEFIRLANEGGGPDNITVIVIKIIETSEAQEFIDGMAAEKRRGFMKAVMAGLATTAILGAIGFFAWRAVNYVPPSPPSMAEIPLVTGSKSLVVNGSGKPGTSAEVFIDGATTARAQVSQDGTWSSSISLDREGNHELKARTIDGSGNAGPFGSSVQISLDLTSPPAPVIEYPFEMQSFSAGSIPVNGKTEAGAKVTIFVDGKMAGECVAAGSGAFSAEIDVASLAEGTHQIQVVSRDEAGNESEDIAISIDTDRTPPPVPEFIFPLDGSMVQTTTVAVMAKARDAETVEFTIDGTKLEAAVTRDGDIFSMNLENLGDEKTYVLEAASRDRAGNVSPSKRLVNFGISTKLPMAPVILTPNNGDTFRSSFELTGKAVPGSIVSISIDGKAVAEVETSSDTGSWKWNSPELQEGSHTMAAKSDSKGIKSPSSESMLVKIDRTPPPAPDFGRGPLFTTSPDFKLVGRTEPDLLLSIKPLVIGGAKVGNPSIASAKSGTGGEVTIGSLGLGEGLNSFEIGSTDHAGNTSAAARVDINLDTRPPATPVLSRVPAFVQQERLRISGTGEPASTVAVEVVPQGDNGGATNGKAPYRSDIPVKPDGSFGPGEIQLFPGKNRLVVRARDGAGNHSPEVSYEVSWYDDLPSVPVLELKPQNQVTGNTLSVRGTANPGFEVSVSLNGRNAVTARASTTGRFSATLDLRDGKNEIEVVSVHPEDANLKSAPARVEVVVAKPQSDPDSGQDRSGEPGSRESGPADSGSSTEQKPAFRTPSPKGKVNINTASATAIASSLDIPISLAEALVAYRMSNGNFTLPSKTLDVPGMLDYFDHVRGFIETAARQGGTGQGVVSRTRTLDSAREIAIGDTVNDAVPPAAQSGRPSARYYKMKPPGRGIVKFLFKGRGLRARIMNDDPLSPSDMTEVKASGDGLLAEWDTTMGWLPSFIVISVEPAGRSSGEIPFSLQTVFTSKGTGEGF